MTDTDKINIAIVDDDYRTLTNLKKLLDFTGKVEVTDIFQSGTDFISHLSQLKAGDFPQAVLMDIDMPGMNGIDCVLIGKARFPQVKFLMLTVYDDEDKLFKAIKAGANGYLLKDEKISVIVRQLEILIYEDGVPLSPVMAAKTFELLKMSKIERASDKDSFHLTEREKEVLQQIVDGKGYKEIAASLFISSNTVKKHIAKIYNKLHVSSKAQAIKMVHFHKLLE